MRAELYSSADADCLWSTMKAVAGNGKSGVLATYFAAIGGGDFDQPADCRPYPDEAYKKYEAYSSEKEQCF